MSESVYQELLRRVGEQQPRRRIEPTRRLVDLLGNPQASAPVVHLTGTNGKTSTARMIESLLRASGLRTGLLTSPHLEHFAERIVIDGEPISDERLAANWDDVKPFVELVDAELTASGDGTLTFFEVLTALAFACFADAPVDVMVIEVGMGGEWDSTNVANGSVAVFTPIDLDHLGRIGNTVSEIAETKAGIIKPGAIVVSAAQRADVRAILTQRASERGATVHSAPEAFGVSEVTLAVGGQLVSLRGIAGSYPDLFVPLFGAHQAENAALAVAAVEAFLGGGTIPLSDVVVTEGFAAATSPGRLEIIGVNPTILVDGAHNPHGVAALVDAMEASFSFEEILVVAAALGEKDSTGMVRELARMSAPLIATASGSERAIPASELAAAAEAVGIQVSTIPSAETAFETARKWAAAAPGRGVLITGSLTLVGEARSVASKQGWRSQ